MEVQVDTSQIKVLQDFFDDLSSIDQRKIFIASYRKAAKPLIAAARADVPKKTHKLEATIGSIELPQEIAILIGSRITRERRWLGYILEYGSFKTGERFWKPFRAIKWRGRYTGEYRGSKGKLKSTGILKADPWFEKAFNATSEGMYDTMAQAWYDEIDRFIIRTNKKLK
jgi:hypothetical protein